MLEALGHALQLCVALMVKSPLIVSTKLDRSAPTIDQLDRVSPLVEHSGDATPA